MTLAVYAALFPLTAKSLRSAQAMARLPPELRKIRERHPDDREKQHEASVELFRGAGVSPLGGCLPVLVQLPVFVVLYQVILGLTRMGPDGGFDPKYLAEDSVLRGALETSGGEMMSFGVDLARTAGGAVQQGLLPAMSIVVLIGAAIGAAYLAQRQVARRQPRPHDQGDAAELVQRLTRFLPLTYLVVGVVAPGGVVLYLLVSNVARLLQQTLLHHLGRGRDTGSSSAGPDAKPRRGSSRPEQGRRSPPRGSRRAPPSRPRNNKKRRRKGGGKAA